MDAATRTTTDTPPKFHALGHRVLGTARCFAWVAIVIGDVGLLAWAAMAAVAPQLLTGPHATPILPAGYEGFTGASWQALATASPETTEYMTLLFRMFGLYGVAFCIVAIAVAATAYRRAEPWAWWALLIGNTITYVGAMAYDQTARAVGPFELSEYLGLAVIYGFLAVTAPVGRGARPSALRHGS